MIVSLGWMLSQTEKKNGCSVWTRCLNRGAPVIRIKGKLEKVKKLMYQAAIGPVPDGFCVVSNCKTKECIDPGHLGLARAPGNGLKLGDECPKCHSMNLVETSNGVGRPPRVVCADCRKEALNEMRAYQQSEEYQKACWRVKDYRKYAREYLVHKFGHN